MMPAVPPPNDDVIVVTVAFEAKTHLKATQIILVKSFSMHFENIFTFSLFNAPNPEPLFNLLSYFVT